MSNETTGVVIDEISGCIDIPDSAYEKAEARYQDLGEWFSRPEAHCADYDPHIYPQGSFRLGTVVRADEYDLDFGCRLRSGISKSTHTQEQLKALVGLDMEEYRQARRIERNLEEKTRCWRLRYKDELSFHMDGVPSIPEDKQQRQLLQERMVKSGSDQFLAQSVAERAGSITDIRLSNYKQISLAWRISNSEGFALWFESRMKLAMSLMEERALRAKAATVDDLPAREWRSPLQKCVQILKCHRDVMFAESPEGKPISVIITSLAGEAYQGEQSIAGALTTILSRMGSLVRETRPHIPNPVNPAEDFTDKWYDSAYRHLSLKDNFWSWLRQAQIDFKVIGQSRDPDFITEQAMIKFGASLDAAGLKRKFGVGAPAVITRPKQHNIIEAPARPWLGLGDAPSFLASLFPLARTSPPPFNRRATNEDVA